MHVQHTNTQCDALPRSSFHSRIRQSLWSSLPKRSVPNNPILCALVWACVPACQRTYSCTCVYASCCWIGIVFPCSSDRAIWRRAQGEEANADLMSRRACRIEKCIGTVMWGDVPISPWGIRVLSCSRWGTPARPHPSTASLLPPYTSLSKIIPLLDVWALARSSARPPWE